MRRRIARNMAEVKDVAMKEAPAEEQDGTSGGDESSEQQQKPTKKDKDLLTVEGCVVIQLETKFFNARCRL